MVDQAYWHLAKTYQNQSVADPRSRILLDELNDAYAVLGTPRLRDEYDQELGADPPRSVKARQPTGGRSWARFLKGKRADQRTDGGTVAVELSTGKGRAKTEATPRRRHTANVSELQSSTAQMLARWRSSTGSPTGSASKLGEPTPADLDTTLVDIFRTEEQVGTHDDPLDAVMNILRSEKATPSGPSTR
jgi:curved DNA-binding protein CbpA